MTKYKIKILTLNIHKGFSLTKRHVTIDSIKENILASGANLVCLQEVVGAFSDIIRKPQFEFLADQIWSHYAYGQNAIYSKGHHGNAILSEHPIIHYKNYDISSYRFEKRGVLHGIIKLSDDTKHNLHVMTLHLDLMSWSRKRQIDKLCSLIEKHVPLESPLIVCGDFNDWRNEFSEYLFERVGINEAHFSHLGSYAKTFPTFLPFLKLDRIYIRNAKIEVISRLNDISWHKLSDHLPIYAEIIF